MEVFESKPPAFSTEELSKIAQDYFNEGGTIKPLVSERDQNARLINNDGEYVLKVANKAEDRELIEFQNAVLNHVALLDPSLAIPTVKKGKEGQEIFDHDGYGIRLISFLEGDIFNGATKSVALYYDLGRFMGRFSSAMQSFGHIKAHQPDFLWNLDNALFSKQYINDIEDKKVKSLIEYYYDRYEQKVAPRLRKMRSAVIHSDANDYNLVVQGDKISGLIDFGDMLFAKQINELAIVLAYAILDVDDLFAVSNAVIDGYTKQFALTEDELEILFDLAAMRLVMSVCISSNRVTKASSDTHKEYLIITQAPAIKALKRLKDVNLSFLACFARKAGGFRATRNYAAVAETLINCQAASLFDFDLNTEPRMMMDLAEGAPGSEYINDPQKHNQWVIDTLNDNDALFGIGGYGENRTAFKFDGCQSLAGPERRTVHTALDFWIEEGCNIYSPLPGTVHNIANNNDAYDFGNTLILRHKLTDNGPVFYTLYGHLSDIALKIGDTVEAGQKISTVGNIKENGGWSTHLHLQIITDLLDTSDGNFPGACEPSVAHVWNDISPDANLITKLAPESFVKSAVSVKDIMNNRAELLAPSLSVAYNKHIHMVRGRGAYLYDHTGRGFLDCVNNIAHVGHCNPHVVDALTAQARLLNTNSRYLYSGINKLASRILSTMPNPLSVMFFVNSGSEANELALRLARHKTGRQTTVVVDWGYHGNTSTTVEISPYKFNRKGGIGCPEHVRIAEFPDPYQGQFKGLGDNNGEKYAADVDAQIADLVEKTGEGPAVFIAESIAGVGGQVVYPDGYLKAAYDKTRSAGGLCIADEVQVGFGRVGDHMWGFQRQGVVPDIVCLGKPIGNGHPMAAVITTREIADAFANGMEYFNSFGGNPVSCAVGLAVMDVIEGEGLQQRALETGNYILDGLRDMMDRQSLIGDVRGSGLFVGAELVKDRDTRERAPQEADAIIQYLRDDAVLLSTDGPYANVLKAKPPMVFGIHEADIFLRKLEKAFKRLGNEGL